MKKEHSEYILMTIGFIFVILLITPTITNSIISIVTGDDVPCAKAPFNPNCYCPAGMIKTQGGFPLQWVCVGREWPSDSSAYCAWCGGECVNWLLYPNYGDEACLSRDPIPGQSCQAIEGYCTAVPFEYKEGLVTFCTDEDWYKFVNEFPGSTAQMSQYLKDRCDGITYWQDGCELNYGGLEAEWGWSSYTGYTVFECLSQCYDTQGQLIGGRVLYELIYHVTNGEIDDKNAPSVIDVGCYDYDTQSCCYNQGITNPYQY